MAEKRRRGKFASFILGGIAGAIGGLLFAPKSGKQTRETIKKRADDIIDQSKDVYDTQREKVTEAVGSGREMAAEKVEDIRARIEDTKKKLQTQVEQATKKAEEATSKVKKKISKE